MSLNLKFLDPVSRLLVEVVTERGPVSARDAINGYRTAPFMPRGGIFDLGDEELRWYLYYLVDRRYLTCRRGDDGFDMFSPSPSTT
jgi:hypothetical protein